MKRFASIALALLLPGYVSAAGFESYPTCSAFGGDELLLVLDDPAGTPVTCKSTYSTIINGLLSTVDLTTDVTGVLPAANGGTGVAALSSLDAANLGAGASLDGYVLTSDGATGAAWEALPASGVTDHGALTGLSDDDHTQYLLIDGSRAMTGNLNLGTSSLTAGTGETLTFLSPETDGATAVGHIFDTANSIANANGKLLSVRNQGSEKFYINLYGHAVFSGGPLLSGNGKLFDIGGGSPYISASIDSPYFRIQQAGGAFASLAIHGSGTGDFNGTAGVKVATGDVRHGLWVGGAFAGSDLAVGDVHITGYDAFSSATINQDGGDLYLRGGRAASGGGTTGLVIMNNLPTSDPGVSGALWYDSTCDSGSGCVRLSP